MVRGLKLAESKIRAVTIVDTDLMFVTITGPWSTIIPVNQLFI